MCRDIKRLGTTALEPYFVSSAGVQAYDNERKGQRSLFVLHFQVNGSIFPLGTKVNEESTFYSMF